MQDIAKHTESKIKDNSDKNLINKIFGVDPVDWSRYPDGRLVFISPTGQKFSYTQEYLDRELQSLRDVQKVSSPSAKKKDSKQDPKQDPRDKAAGAAAK